MLAAIATNATKAIMLLQLLSEEFLRFILSFLLVRRVKPAIVVKPASASFVDISLPTVNPAFGAGAFLIKY
jgi:hypothetical protein